MVEEERKSRRKSLIITTLVQVVVLVVLYFLTAWKAPFPPIEEFGIELSFVQGGRTIVPTAPREEPTPIQPVSQEVPEESGPEPQEVSESSEEVIEDLEGDEELAVEEEAEPEESLDEEITEEQENDSQDQSELTVASEEEEDMTEEPAAPVIDERALFRNSGSTDDEGASLQLSGWIWDFEPTPMDDSSETGKVVYQITIDNEGYILKIVTLSSTLTPSVEKYYRQAVERLTFSKTSGYKPARTSTGTITFIIQSK